MRILDRERYKDFIKAYIICFIALVGLYIVIDAFNNLDEFSETNQGAVKMLHAMGRYYGIRLCLFYDQLCGVITMMAAIFAVTWLQKNNELLAMMAAGISAKRVILPVVIGAVLMSGLALLNQEWVIPRFAEELQQPPDDFAMRKLSVWSRFDVNDILIHGTDGYRGTKTIEPFYASFPVSRFGSVVTLEATEGRYIPEQDTRYPRRGGWLLRGAKLVTGESQVDLGVLEKLDDETARQFPEARGSVKIHEGETMFLKTNVTFASLTRSQNWYLFAPTIDLFQSLTDPASDSERTRIAGYLHMRLLRPMMSLILLCLSLPLVMGGQNRNMFINLGMSLATSALVYGSIFFLQYLSNSRVLQPEQAAWAPLVVFGTLASLRWDRIRT
jgi:lipopolysaccharide export system permease protein